MQQQALQTPSPYIQRPILKLLEKPAARPQFSPPLWWDKEMPKNYTGRTRSVVKSFIEGTLTKTVFDRRACNDNHVYSTRKNGTELWMFKNNPSIKRHVCVARMVGGVFLGNSSSIAFARDTKGKVRSVPTGQLKIQEVLSECMTMVPFDLFKDAKLDLDSISIIEKGPSEILNVGRSEPLHYTGALCFKIEMRARSRGITGEKDRYYLFDADRNDVRLRNLNLFMSRLSRPVKSIADAYDSLKPQEVRDAEMVMGKPCERQGEWFFIPIQGHFARALDRTRMGRPARQEAVLQSKGNRAHYVTELSEEGYVRGKVSHSGHEHKPITLDVWCKAVPNTAVESFKISGAVD